MNQNLKIFLIGVVGGMVGVFLTGILILGFFSISSRFSQIEIYCEQGKEIKKRDVGCELAAIEDKGEILRESEIIMPLNANELKPQDMITSGKFLEVKVKIKNERKEAVNISSITLSDKEGRKYQNTWETYYWIDKNLQSGNIGPGLSREFAQIFKIPQNAQEFKVKAMIWRGGMVD